MIRFKSSLSIGFLAVVLAATFVGDVNAGRRKGPNPGKPGKANFVVEELTTKQFRADNIAKFARPKGRLLHSQLRIAAAMAVNTAPAGYEDAFPFWEFRLEPGKYRMVFKFGDAKWTNKMIVGTVKEKGQPNFDCQFGAIDNRRARGDVVFELTEVSIVRFEEWTNQPGVGWHKALTRHRSFEEMLIFDSEDGADADWNDLMVYVIKAR
jgi:hypothetical protein